ncbi:MAG: type 1 glutamine amidotransferase-like domain-containing protein [Chloroflexi bacterium]|nr:type 1 glutamine amidotransferase-like domain-containing protein [Chloroflexota bacterium]
MLGHLVLNGGEAFSPAARPLDSRWLQLIRRAHARPRVVVIPAADVSGTRRQADRVMRYFNNLGTFAEYTMIDSHDAANARAHTLILDKVEGLVLTDGSAIDMVERVRGTKTEAALRRALEERRAVVMASGAGAMALGAVYWMGGLWEPGLGIAPQLAILPHHNLVQMRLSPEKLLADLPEGVTIIGIDDLTYLTWTPDNTYEVSGKGEVMVYRSAEQQDTYRDGATFALN